MLAALMRPHAQADAPAKAAAAPQSDGQAAPGTRAMFPGAVLRAASTMVRCPCWRASCSPRWLSARASSPTPAPSVAPHRAAAPSVWAAPVVAAARCFASQLRAASPCLEGGRSSSRRRLAAFLCAARSNNSLRGIFADQHLDADCGDLVRFDEISTGRIGRIDSLVACDGIDVSAVGQLLARCCPPRRSKPSSRIRRAEACRPRIAVADYRARPASPHR